MSLVLSAIQVRYRDIGVGLPLVLQVWMFATPVIYPLSVVPMKWRSVYLLNPMVGIIESFRRVVLRVRSQRSRRWRRRPQFRRSCCRCIRLLQARRSDSGRCRLNRLVRMR